MLSEYFGWVCISCTKRKMWKILNRGRQDAIPDRCSIMKWAYVMLCACETRKYFWICRGSEKVFLAVTAPSTRKYARALWLSARTVWRRLHLDLKFHPQTMTVVKLQNRLICCQRLLEVILDNTVVFFSCQFHFHLLGDVSKQIMRNWSKPVNFKNSFHIVNIWTYIVWFLLTVLLALISSKNLHRFGTL